MEATLHPIDLLIEDVHLATMAEATEPYGAIRDGALAVADGVIAWIGPRTAVPGELRRTARRRLSGGGMWVTPGLIDCHTHLVFGGHRADEFEARLKGVRYEEIARAGGGIRATVRATREADDDVLRAAGRARLRGMREHGLTTVEIKSGYGLTTEHELRMLRVARNLEEDTDVTVITTLLALHALPDEFAHRREAYVELVCREMIPLAAREGLASAVDAFCESIAFTPDECARAFAEATRHGLEVRVHADQLADGGGAALAARFGARSADHLEYTSEAGVRAMARAGTTAVLLPGAYHVLGADRTPPVELFRVLGVPMAVGTDFNPGSSPVCQPLLAMHLACVHFRLTPEEALAGMTRHAARVLDLEAAGILRPGARADLALWEVETPAELAYWIGANPCRGVIRAGATNDPRLSSLLRDV